MYAKQSLKARVQLIVQHWSPMSSTYVIGIWKALYIKTRTRGSINMCLKLIPYLAYRKISHCLISELKADKKAG